MCRLIDWPSKLRNLDQDNACAAVLLSYRGFFLEQLLKKYLPKRDGTAYDDEEKKRSMYLADKNL